MAKLISGKEVSTQIRQKIRVSIPLKGVPTWQVSAVH